MYTHRRLPACPASLRLQAGCKGDGYLRATRPASRSSHGSKPSPAPSICASSAATCEAAEARNAEAAQGAVCGGGVGAWGRGLGLLSKARATQVGTEQDRCRCPLLQPATQPPPELLLGKPASPASPAASSREGAAPRSAAHAGARLTTPPPPAPAASAAAAKPHRRWLRRRH